MKTAIVLGRGPDVDVVLATQVEKPSFELFVTNLSHYRPGERAAKLPLIDVFDVRGAKRMLVEHDIDRIVSIGSFKLAGAYQYLRSAAALQEAKPLVLAIFTHASDEIRRVVFERFANDFEFPSVKEVLPCLFAGEDVSVMADNTLLHLALSASARQRKDTPLLVAGRKTMVFRIPDGQRSSLATRRLYLAKLESIHSKQGVKHVFFDRDQTIVVNLEEMISYARQRGLTFQSFRNPSSF
jgi:DUF1009 family protein